MKVSLSLSTIGKIILEFMLQDGSWASLGSS